MTITINIIEETYLISTRGAHKIHTLYLLVYNPQKKISKISFKRLIKIKFN